MKPRIETCEGCGAKIQFEDPRVPGYIPKEVYSRRLSEGKEILCQRCFQIKYYSKLKHINFSSEIFMTQFREVVKGFSNILWVIDIFDFEGSFRREFSELFEDKNVIYIINKIDLLPKAITRKEIHDWVFKRIRSDQIYLVSAFKNLGIKSLFRRLKIVKDKILLVGCTNVGKSSLINRMCGTDITVSSYPNTTLNLIKAKPFGLDLDLYDTPGISFNDRFIDILSPSCQKKILPHRELSRKTFKAVTGRVYLLGALVQIRVKEVKTDKSIFQLFAPENVVIHDTKPERVKDLLKRQAGRFLVPPCKPKEISFDTLNWSKKSIIIKEGKEIVFPGIGWLTMKKGAAVFEIHIPGKLKIFVRDALINPKRRSKT